MTASAEYRTPFRQDLQNMPQMLHFSPVPKSIYDTEENPEAYSMVKATVTSSISL